MPKANITHKPGAGSTGPTSVAGRETSSRNATTHGARSEKHVILATECVDDYGELCERWHDEYPPTTALEVQLLERLTQRDWHLQRCDRLYNDAFMNAMNENPDPMSWPDELHDKIDRMQRYRSIAERAWRAAHKDLIALRKTRVDYIRSLEQTRRIHFINLRDKLVQTPTREPAQSEPQPSKTQPKDSADVIQKNHTQSEEIPI